MSVPTLPTEIVSQNVDYLSHDDLALALTKGASASAGKNDHFEQFSRVIAGDEVLTSPISAYIHILCVQYVLGNTNITEPALVTLEPYVLRLSQL
ncbi:hypothetical protein RSAG8_10819, partial [Rhizoctonia solani AG-8 WAC10335]